MTKGVLVDSAQDVSWSVQRLRDFLHDCAASEPAEEADRVREAIAVLPQRHGSHFQAQAVESLLESGAALCAVLVILGPHARFMLSRGEDGRCLATVLAADGHEEMVAEGTTLALALLTAQASARLVGLERAERVAQRAVPLTARLH